MLTDNNSFFFFNFLRKKGLDILSKSSLIEMIHMKCWLIIKPYILRNKKKTREYLKFVLC